MKEYMGMPHFPDEKEQYPLVVDDPWTYATTFGDLYEVVTREDGSLTVKKKNE